MPLPDPHANESSIEVDRDTWKLLQEAKKAVEAWTTEYNRLKNKLREEMGDAYAATVDGAKVYTNRPKEQYAEGALIKAYPDLTAHFFEDQTKSVFNIDKFKEQHPDIAEQYRVRALVEVKGL